MFSTTDLYNLIPASTAKPNAFGSKLGRVSPETKAIHPRFLLLGFLFASVFGFCTASRAQEVGAITGVVTDQTGAVLADVEVKLVDTKTSSSFSTTTNNVGAYTFSRVLPGPGYKLELEKQGFDSSVILNVYIAVAATRIQNVQMQLGQVSQSVEVNGEGSAVSLDTTDTTVGNTFDMKLVHELPVQVRDNPAEIMRLQPGVVSAAQIDDPNQSRDGATAGARTDQGNVSLDGLDVNDFNAGFAISVVANAPVDSIQEFRGETANPLSAEGRGSGLQIQMVTKSGTNAFHGSVYEYNRNASFEANSYLNNLTIPKVPRAALVRNQFGASLGGPIKKNKLFFFFNYEGRRDASSGSTEQIVPLPSFAAGNVSYINNGPGCTTSSRINTQPSCISTISQTSSTPGTTTLQGLDPQGLGFNSSLQQFVSRRYPPPNDLSAGDGVNTAGLRFNSPRNNNLNEYVVRLDYNLNSRMKIFARGSLERNPSDASNTSAAIAFPGDPLTIQTIDHSYAYVFGHTWTISNNKINQFVYGETRQVFKFPVLFNPTGTTNYLAFDSISSGGGNLSSPYFSGSPQSRIIPVPVVRDDFTYTRGTHTFQVGGTFKPIETHTALTNDLNNVTLGIGGGLQGLDSTLRPKDILAGSVSTDIWDSAFTFGLGRFAQIVSSFNNNAKLSPLPQGSGHRRDYRFYETEAYLQDTWRVRSDLTVTYGLRYQYYSVPYEVHGLESIPNIGFHQFLNPRIANGLAGNSGPLVNPIVSYSKGGKANHAPGMYHPDWKDFQPRLAFAYNPSVTEGIWGKLMGDRKTVIRAGAGLIDDHSTIGSLLNFQDQFSYLFQNTSTTIYGKQTNNPRADLMADPRWTTLGALPAGSVVIPPPLTTPYTPYVSGGQPFGLANNVGFNYAIDPNLKTPYSETVSFGIQRELPGNFQLDATYVGRFAHRLLAQSDAGQTVDFKDPASGQFLGPAFALLSQQVRSQTPPQGQPYIVTPQPFFENQVGTGGTSLIANGITGLVTRGDLADTVQQLIINNLIAPGVGLSPQFGTNLYITNQSYSNYNALLATLHKKMSHGLQFDLNYSYSHSLDNISVTPNAAFGSNGAGGILCDAIHLGVCYGNSDFDATHVVTADGLYELPFGRGKRFGSQMPKWLDQIAGGWSISGVNTWRTGLAFQTVGNAFPISFANNTPAIFNGNTAAIRDHIHVESGQVQLFANPGAAVGAFSGPLGIQAGSRNNLRGPHFSEASLGLAKHFTVTEKLGVEFRADAFNVFNHANFGLPGTSGTADISNPSSFGVINNMAGDPRVLQLALRIDF